MFKFIFVDMKKSATLWNDLNDRRMAVTLGKPSKNGGKPCLFNEITAFRRTKTKVRYSLWW